MELMYQKSMPSTSLHAFPAMMLLEKAKTIEEEEIGDQIEKIEVQFTPPPSTSDMNAFRDSIADALTTMRE